MPEQPLYSWRNKARGSGVRARKNSTTEQWSADAKLAVVIEAAWLSELELSQYCRERGLYVEQVSDWKAQCLGGFQSSPELAGDF